MDLSNLTDAHREAWLTDERWGRELHRIFGNRAGDVRFTPAGKGAPGSHLRALHDARMVAQAAWDAEIQATRRYRGGGRLAGPREDQTADDGRYHGPDERF
jgi:hypothetical protein